MIKRPNETEQYLEQWTLYWCMQGVSAPDAVDGESLSESGMPSVPATVPGNVELDLVRAGLMEEPFVGMNIAKLRDWEHATWYYHCVFRASVGGVHDRWLVFDGIDCIASIYLNGVLLGRTDNMLIPHRFPVERHLRVQNELVVRIDSAVAEAQRFTYPPVLNALPSNRESLYIRKAPHMYGWDIMPRAVSAGLWRPVRLVDQRAERIEDVWLETRAIAPDRSWADVCAHLWVKTTGPRHPRTRVCISGSCGDSSFHTECPLLFDQGRHTFRITDPRIWQPNGRGEPCLYDVTVTWIDEDFEIDRVELSLGVRTVELDHTPVTDASGSGRFQFIVNGEPLFVMGSNWVPLDAFHSRDVERVDQALDMAQHIGCNMLRCWGGNVYESDAFYSGCDRRGLLVWQDFAMACGLYPQDADFQERLRIEARNVVRRLRSHACLAVWSGDNECDYNWIHEGLNPGDNVLTRRVLPEVLREEMPRAPYLPSSPWFSPEALAGDIQMLLPENHLWDRADYMGPFYTQSVCHFAGEIGYHGCPDESSIRRFITPEHIWPPENNPEWTLHSTSPVPGIDCYDYRVGLMGRQIRVLFDAVPDNLADYAYASQCVQAEAYKFWIEMFRLGRPHRTGILWWNLLDGWPQFSDAVVDYYFTPKRAFHAIRRVQNPLCLIARESPLGGLEITVSSLLRESVALNCRIVDCSSQREVFCGVVAAAPDTLTPVVTLPAEHKPVFLAMCWRAGDQSGENHALWASRPVSLTWYREMVVRCEDVWRDGIG